ncbi:hypothetical protein TNCV_1740951 [Trichonephila clavipes]|uniref:Uncharacterized protein n=1 Tax=Trichonephila clavipes TaxID=2585209 RepID=A0A8X6RKL7_TRICX|nr:hypothetical protein TNCV_1740951 [Trichonephila clavipes]
MSREWDNINRWFDGQVCPDVGQGIMAPWLRRPGCVFGCYGQIGLGGERDFGGLLTRKDEGRVVDPPLVLKRFFFQNTGGKNPVLDRENWRGEPWLERTGGESWTERT